MPEKKVCFFCIQDTFEGVAICPSCRFRYDQAKKDLERYRRMYASERAGFFRLSKENERLRAGFLRLEDELAKLKRKKKST